MVVNHGIADGFSNIAVGQTQIIAAKRQLNVVCQSGVEEKSVEAKTQPADQETEAGRAQVCSVFAFIKKSGFASETAYLSHTKSLFETELLVWR
jgi:hypothetical protein